MFWIFAFLYGNYCFYTTCNKKIRTRIVDFHVTMEQFLERYFAWSCRKWVHYYFLDYFQYQSSLLTIMPIVNSYQKYDQDRSHSVIRISFTKLISENEKYIIWIGRILLVCKFFVFFLFFFFLVHICHVWFLTLLELTARFEPHSSLLKYVFVWRFC